MLHPDGKSLIAPRTQDYAAARRRTLGVIEQRFGPSLSPAYPKEAPLPA
ncbi:hypothetical protein ABZ172_01650 [Streptomyces sp. NPDC006296]